MEESKNVLCPHMDLIKPFEDEKFATKTFLVKKKQTKFYKKKGLFNKKFI